MNFHMEISIVMPCLNESETLAVCVDKAIVFLRDNNIQGEVLVADNGSTDDFILIAAEHGARVVNIPTKGYGAALMGGIQEAFGQYVIIGDADDSYDFSALMPFVEKLREGYELVMGNRFWEGIRPGAMPFLHKYLGNPILSFLGRLFFGSSVGISIADCADFCRDSILSLNLRTTGMEYASEMVVKATLNKLDNGSADRFIS